MRSHHRTVSSLRVPAAQRGTCVKRRLAAGVKLDTALVQSDDVYAQIIATAKKKKCDLICIASHGRRGLASVMLGSETQKVLTHSKTPVLVLR